MVDTQHPRSSAGVSRARSSLVEALVKPIAPSSDEQSCDFFDPWDDVMGGIHGSYSSASDQLMVEALEAARDRSTFDFINRRGFVGEFALYVLSGLGMLNYGSSPRGGWPDEDIADLWQPLIDKWIAYADVAWGQRGWRDSL
ncbi:hypothetical protein [Brevundimonas sp.]|uniref:hypothetical protein n=1 Tax=Brevundimonas sp. TaxID=1871086 RepID=UPI0035AE8C15